LTHIVWDWNGTLAADHDVVVDSVNAVMNSFGRNPITTDDYRAHYRRPVRLLYEHFLETSVSEPDWRRINTIFLDHYMGNLANIELAPGAHESLAHCAERGHTQSLLSMFRNDLLLQEVDRLRIGDWFQRIDGNNGSGDAPKGDSLARHLRDLNIKPQDAALIADTEDDALAAQRVGARVVLVSGTQRRDRLAATGAPVVDSLADAVATLLDR
jgi:phosphoglycolate phosphatase-like HAD superfamily hydrolase